MRSFCRLASIVIAVIALGQGTMSATSGLTARQSQITTEKNQLAAKIRDAEGRAKKLNSQIAESDQRRVTLEAEISSLTAQIRDAELQLDETEAALGIARTDLYQTETSLARTLSRVDEQRTLLNKRAASSYKIGSAAHLELLLGAESYRDFLTRLEFVRKVFSEDRARLDSVERLSRQLEVARSEASQRRDDITAQKTSIELEKNRIANLKQQLTNARQRVVNEIGSRRQLLSKVQAEKATYLEAMRRLDSESRSIGALLKSRQRGQVFQAGSGKQLAWPTTGAVTSAFGWRTHPIFGDRRFHAGIDIGAPSGARVIASESGTVLWAARNSGYGNAVVIDHGNALATLYAHLSSISVSEGQKVGRGTTIGAVGCTGYCTGPHLHFETRVNGDPVDPMRFF